MSARQPVIAGNWKMYKTGRQAGEFTREFIPQVKAAGHCEIVLAPPFTALEAVRRELRGHRVGLAAQDVHWDQEGAQTGEISAPMLVGAGCSHVIIGHSERRQYHGESDEAVNRKVKAALAEGLAPLVCVGESLNERESGQTEKVLVGQCEGGFAGLTPSQFSRIIIAYEPVWAIGTGKTATPDLAAETHALIRNWVRQTQGDSVAGSLRILYGGSVKPENIFGLMAKEEIDGALVGGASLQPDSLAAIVNYLS